MLIRNWNPIGISYHMFIVVGVNGGFRGSPCRRKCPTSERRRRERCGRGRRGLGRLDKLLFYFFLVTKINDVDFRDKTNNDMFSFILTSHFFGCPVITFSSEFRPVLFLIFQNLYSLWFKTDTYIIIISSFSLTTPL